MRVKSVGQQTIDGIAIDGIDEGEILIACENIEFSLLLARDAAVAGKERPGQREQFRFAALQNYRAAHAELMKIHTLLLGDSPV